MPFRIDYELIEQKKKEEEKIGGWCQEMKLADIQAHLKKPNFLTKIFGIFKKKGRSVK